jgi:cytochrome c553
VRRRQRALLVAAAAFAAAVPCGAADDAVRAQAQQVCAVCHGPAGISSAPDAPNLAGQPEAYLAAQLRAFRAGTRRHEVMAVIAKPLTDEQIGALARWYAGIKVTATPP